MELYHHGIKGQKWGVRRYQNPDGSLTPEGEKRYLELDAKRAQNSEKIRKLNEKVIDSSPRKNRLERKMARKQSIMARGMRRVNRGKNMTGRQRRATKAVSRLGRKLARVDRRATWRSRAIKRLDRQNRRYEKQMQSLIANVGSAKLSSMNAQIERGKAYLEG